MHDFKANWIKKLAIGTVQFGLDYGISNRSGRVRRKTVADILDYAFNCGIDTLDTAVVYGCSEEVIGSVIATKQYNFDIVSKFPPETTSDSLNKFLNSTLQRLRAKEIKAYLAHDFNSFKNQNLRKQLSLAKDKGLIRQVGVSVHYPDEVTWLLKEDISFDIIQLPFSIFDQRFKPLFSELKKQKVEIHVRSVFLQGLYAISPDDLPQYFHSIKEKLKELRQFCKMKDIPLFALLLNYAFMQEIDKVVFGVTGLEELRQNIDAHNYMKKCYMLDSILNSFAVSDEQIILPSNWR